MIHYDFYYINVHIFVILQFDWHISFLRESVLLWLLFALFLFLLLIFCLSGYVHFGAAAFRLRLADDIVGLTIHISAAEIGHFDSALYIGEAFHLKLTCRGKLVRIIFNWCLLTADAWGKLIRSRGPNLYPRLLPLIHSLQETDNRHACMSTRRNEDKTKSRGNLLRKQRNLP